MIARHQCALAPIAAEQIILQLGLQLRLGYNREVGEIGQRADGRRIDALPVVEAPVERHGLIGVTHQGAETFGLPGLQLLRGPPLGPLRMPERPQADERATGIGQASGRGGSRMGGAARPADVVGRNLGQAVAPSASDSGADHSVVRLGRQKRPC